MSTPHLWNKPIHVKVWHRSYVNNSSCISVGLCMNFKCSCSPSSLNLRLRSSVLRSQRFVPKRHMSTAQREKEVGKREWKDLSEWDRWRDTGQWCWIQRFRDVGARVLRGQQIPACMVERRFVTLSRLSSSSSLLSPQFDINQLMTSVNVSQSLSPIHKPLESPGSVGSGSNGGSVGGAGGAGVEQSPVDRTKGFFPDESEPLLRCDSTSSKDSALSRNGSFITKGERPSLAWITVIKLNHDNNRS